MYPEWKQEVYLDGKLYKIADAVRNLEEKLLRYCTSKETVVAISCANNLNFIMAYYALFKNDIIPLVLKHQPAPEEFSQLNADFILTDQSGEIEMLPLNSSSKYPDIREYQVILKTSGSTGEPKHLGWSASAIHYQSVATSKILEYTADDCLAIMMLISLAYSLSLIHIAFYNNLPLCLSTSLDPGHFLKILAPSKATTLDGLPELFVNMLAYLQKHPEAKEELRGIHAWNSGGNMLTHDVIAQWQSCMKTPILDGYGLSEAGPNIAVSGPNRFRIGTVGQALEGTVLKLTEEGELLAKSPSVIKNYLKGHHLIIDNEGWLHTGDLAKIDQDGYVTILGRKPVH